MLQWVKRGQEKRPLATANVTAATDRGSCGRVLLNDEVRAGQALDQRFSVRPSTFSRVFSYSNVLLSAGSNAGVTEPKAVPRMRNMTRTTLLTTFLTAA